MASDLERADALGANQIESNYKLDYFILGVSLAVCAYLAQTNPYSPVGFNEPTFLLLSLLVFSASSICGFRRIEARTQHTLASANALKAVSGGDRAAWFAEGNMYRLRCMKFYHYRNRLLLSGFVCYLATKVWATYQSHGWIPVG